MGTKLHSKAYFPEYYSTRDLIKAGNGMWALYDEGKSFQNGQVNDSFLASSTVDRYIGYNKENVRQTILKHELVFREQLQELHRLYRRQKDLMNEFGRRQLHKSLLSAETPKPSLLTLQTPIEDANNISRVFDSYMIKGKSTCSKLSSHDRTHLEDYEFLKPEYKFQRNLFEPELDDKVYMKDEGKQGERICGVEGTESFPLEKNNLSLSNLDMNLCSGSVSDSQSNGHAKKSMLNLKENHKLVDLNEPILVEETSTTDPVRNVGISIHLREDIKNRDIFGSLGSRSQSQSKESYQSCLGEKEGRSVLNTIQSESVKNGNEHLTRNCKSGKTRFYDHTSLGNINNDRPCTYFRSSEVDPRKNYDTLRFSDCDRNSEAPQRMRTIFGVEISDGNQNRSSNTCYSPSLRPLIQQTEAMGSETSSISPTRKTCSALAQNSVSSQDSPGHQILSPLSRKRPSSVMQMPEFSGEKSTNNLRPIPGSKYGTSHQSALCFGSQLNAKQHRYLDLNSYVAAASKFQDRVVAQQDSVYADTKIRSTDKQIKTEVMYQMSLDSLQNHSHNFFSKTEVSNGPSKDFTSSTRAANSDRKRADDCDSKSSSNILGIPIVNVPYIPKVLISPKCPSKPISYVSGLDCDGTSKVCTHNFKSDSQHDETYTVADNGLNNNFSGLRHQIDLNLSLNEEETPSIPYVPVAVMKIAETEIDLEAPAGPALLESVTDVSFETDHLKKKTKMCSEVSLVDSSEQYDERSRVAAEAIINISLSQLDFLDPTCQLPVALTSNSLVLLADVISSYEGSGHESKVTKGGLTNVDDTFDEKNVPQGMDYFEFMTLKLQDTKVEEYRSRPFVLDGCNNEDSTVTSVTKRGRQRQARRGRQLRDFQRDILPGLVSLSRREVTEDLQAIEEIFKASGQTWQSSFSRRRAARNGRGRNPLVDLAPSQTATVGCLPPSVQQPTCRELEVEDRNLTRWGKRTRRLPRQRCSIGNHSAILNC